MSPNTKEYPYEPLPKNIKDDVETWTDYWDERYEQEYRENNELARHVYVEEW